MSTGTKIAWFVGAMVLGAGLALGVSYAIVKAKAAKAA